MTTQASIYGTLNSIVNGRPRRTRNMIWKGWLISTTTGTGLRSRTMDDAGDQRSRRRGVPTTRGTGITGRRTGGIGCLMNPGAGRRIITGPGSGPVTTGGPGSPVGTGDRHGPGGGHQMAITTGHPDTRMTDIAGIVITGATTGTTTSHLSTPDSKSHERSCESNSMLFPMRIRTATGAVMPMKCNSPASVLLVTREQFHGPRCWLIGNPNLYACPVRSAKNRSSHALIHARPESIVHDRSARHHRNPEMSDHRAAPNRSPNPRTNRVASPHRSAHDPEPLTSPHNPVPLQSPTPPADRAVYTRRSAHDPEPLISRHNPVPHRSPTPPANRAAHTRRSVHDPIPSVSRHNPILHRSPTPERQKSIKRIKKAKPHARKKPKKLPPKPRQSPRRNHNSLNRSNPSAPGCSCFVLFQGRKDAASGSRNHSALLDPGRIT